MIKASEGRIILDGSGSELLADLTCIVKGICKTLIEDFEVPPEEAGKMLDYSTVLGIIEAFKGDENDGN